MTLISWQFLTSVPVVSLLASTYVSAESHLVRFDNRCGFGTPTLIQGSNILSTGGDYTINGPLVSAVAYLQTGNCLVNGENCEVVKTTLVNPTSSNASGSSTEILCNPPYAPGVAGFQYQGGCNGASDFNCSMNPVTCQSDNVNLLIEFCADNLF